MFLLCFKNVILFVTFVMHLLHLKDFLLLPYVLEGV